MHFAIIIAASACALASVQPRKESTPYMQLNHFYYVKDPLNLCGASTFVNETSSSSPLVQDCVHLADKLYTFPLTTGSTADSHHDNHPYLVMASHGTCQISIQQINNFIAGEPGMVSYPDAADLIHDSIAKFNAFQGLSGGVGASGEMKCKSFPSEYSPHKMLWRIDAKPADAKDVMPTW